MVISIPPAMPPLVAGSQFTVKQEVKLEDLLTPLFPIVSAVICYGQLIVHVIRYGQLTVNIVRYARLTECLLSDL